MDLVLSSYEEEKWIFISENNMKSEKKSGGIALPEVRRSLVTFPEN